MGTGKIGFCGIVFILLLLLKVGVVETCVMGWSWLLITLPLWAPIAVFVGLAAAGVFLGVVVGLITWLVDKK